MVGSTLSPMKTDANSFNGEFTTSYASDMNILPKKKVALRDNLVLCRLNTSISIYRVTQPLVIQRKRASGMAELDGIRVPRPVLFQIAMLHKD